MISKFIHMAGEIVSFQKDEVRDYGVAEITLMPPALDNRLTINDLQDLVSFLKGSLQF